MKRLVIDATTLVSGSANPHGESPPGLLYADLAGARFELIACPRLLVEVERGLGKPYFCERVSDEELGEIVAGITDAATMREDPMESNRSCATPTMTTSSHSPGTRRLRRLSAATRTFSTTRV